MPPMPDLTSPPDHPSWLSIVKSRIRSACSTAARAVNGEFLSRTDGANGVRRTEDATCFEKISRFETVGTTRKRARNPLQSATAMSSPCDDNPDRNPDKLSGFRFQIPHSEVGPAILAGARYPDIELCNIAVEPLSRHFSRQNVATDKNPFLRVRTIKPDRSF
jgi:hypothetical protein